MRICKMCGEKFEPFSNSQKYCNECRIKKNKKIGNEVINKICAECGIPFESKRASARIYCSTKCGKKAHNRRYKENNPRHCIICDKILTDKSQVKYCSEECKIKGTRAYYKKKKKNNSATLSEVSRLAREEGLSYGQYVLKHGL